MPDWMFLEEQTQYQAYAKNVLLVTFALQLLLTGVALPWVEELYFRGYLLPRLSRYGMCNAVASRPHSEYDRATAAPSWRPMIPQIEAWFSVQLQRGLTSPMMLPIRHK
jgi:hypothetical protein